MGEMECTQVSRFLDRQPGPVPHSCQAVHAAGARAAHPPNSTRASQQLDPHHLLRQALKIAGMHPDIAFGKYDQSSACTRLSDSSVSYASALVTLPA